MEYDHVHLLVEADNNKILGQGMQSFGICFSKGINKIKHLAGRVFKTRYHYRQLKTPREIKNAFNYIVGNAMKHKEASSILSLYNSLVMVENFNRLYPGFEQMIDETIKKNRSLNVLREDLRTILSMPGTYLVRQAIT